MFIGHFGAALAAKPFAPRASLGTLIAAAQLVDLVWPVLLLLGAERVIIRPGDTAFTPLEFVSYPWTHSLLMVLAWAALFGVVYRARTHDLSGAWVIAALVVSHWVLDFVTHRPDLPLAFGATKVGLGLWNSRPGTIAVEGALFSAGVYLYARTTQPRNRRGRWALVGLVVLLVALYFANQGPPPPSPTAIGVVGLFGALFIPWGAWIDRNRFVRPVTD